MRPLRRVFRGDRRGRVTVRWHAPSRFYVTELGVEGLRARVAVARDDDQVAVVQVQRRRWRRWRAVGDGRLVRLGHVRSVAREMLLAWNDRRWDNNGKERK